MMLVVGIKALGLEDLGLRIRGIGAVEEIAGGRGDDLFHFSRNEHTSDPDKLEFDEGDDAGGKETVYGVDTEE